MRIFYFARINISIEDAGTRHVFEFCRQFARMGHEVVLFVPDLGVRRPLDGVSFVHVPVLVRKPAFTFFSFHVFLFFFFLYHYFKRRPDVVYTRHQQMEWLTTWLRRVLGFTYAVEINGLSAVELKLKGVSAWIVEATRIMERFCFRLPDLLVVPTTRIGSYLRENYGLKEKRFLAASNGANPQSCRPMDQRICREKLKLAPDGRYLLFMGSFKKWHGIVEVVRIMPELVKNDPDIRLLVVGDGELRPVIENIIREEGLRDRVLLYGFVPFEDVPVYINAADICLAPFFDERSDVTGLSPLKMFDYMACGKPVVSSAVGGLGEFFKTYRIGEAVDSKDPHSWAPVIARLLRDPVRLREYGENGRKAVLSEFNWESICKKIEKALDAVRRAA